MNNYQNQVIQAIRATVFHSPTTYSWFGTLSPKLPSTLRKTFSSANTRKYLLSSLQFRLYDDFYCKGFAAGTMQQTDYLTTLNMTPFVENLSEANCGTGYMEDGWKVHAIEDNEVEVYKNGLWLRVRSEELMTHERPLTVGTHVYLRFPKESFAISPGFYMATGNKDLEERKQQDLLRIYWNLAPTGAIRFMHSVTSMLNKANLPFKLKTQNDPTRYTRCDATVLYVRKSDYHLVSRILAKIYPQFTNELRHGTPVFTKVLAEGLGLAEDPGDGSSFGLYRCGILADGMIRAYEQGKKSIEDRLQIIEDRFLEDGICLEKPYLNANSKDLYDFKISNERGLSIARPITKQSYKDLDSSVLLWTSYAIAKWLAQHAVWHEDLCNWIGPSTEDIAISRSLEDRRYEALGPDLYSGTTGLALFFAELYDTTRKNWLREIALGSIRRSILHANLLPLRNCRGFYTGKLGIAFGAVRVGGLLQDKKLQEDAIRLLISCLNEPSKDDEFDIMSGKAGTIAALLTLRNFVNDESLLNVATRLGEDLLLSAEKSHAGYSWKAVSQPYTHNLTGFSHGAAGVAHALLELFLSTEDARYRKGAEKAFDYERYWFSPESGNWPDFREGKSSLRGNNRPLAFGLSWCHGAPGIALSRLRAYEILGSNKYKAEALTALDTTCKIVKKWLYAGTENFCLCHGLAGNAEVLLYASQILGDEWLVGLELAHSVARTGIRMIENLDHSWLCERVLVETPGLMLGLAGVGYFYLRLYDPRVASVLIMRSSSFTK